MRHEHWSFREDGCRGERPSRPRIRTEPETQTMRVDGLWTNEPQPRAIYLVVRRVNDELTLALDPPVERIADP